MNRRTLLGTCGGLFTATVAGCLDLGSNTPNRRLMFIRIHNASDWSEVDIRVTRDGVVAFEESFSLPAFEPDNDKENPEATFYDWPHAELLVDEWKTDPAPFEVEYRLTGGEWNQEDFADSEKEIVGISVDIQGFDYTTVNHRVYEFDSTEQVEELLSE